MRKNARRRTQLGRMLRERRLELQADIQSRKRHKRAERAMGVGDELDHSDAAMQGELDLALLQMRTDTLLRIDAALDRLEAGHYGSCAECSGEIAEARLRALPFALRCQACEGRREADHQRGRTGAVQAGLSPLFPEASGF